MHIKYVFTSFFSILWVRHQTLKWKISGSACFLLHVPYLSHFRLIFTSLWNSVFLKPVWKWLVFWVSMCTFRLLHPKWIWFFLGLWIYCFVLDEPYVLIRLIEFLENLYRNISSAEMKCILWVWNIRQYFLMQLCHCHLCILSSNAIPICKYVEFQNISFIQCTLSFAFSVFPVSIFSKYLSDLKKALISNWV